MESWLFQLHRFVMYKCDGDGGCEKMKTSNFFLEIQQLKQIELKFNRMHLFGLVGWQIVHLNEL